MKEVWHSPPPLFLRFFRWFCHPKLLKYIEGDLMELYDERVRASGKRKADLKFIIDVLLLFRPGIIRPSKGYESLTTYGMYKSYFKIAWRNLLKNKGYSFINIAGLAIGIAVTMLIGLWVYDEVSFNKYHKNYDRIALVLKNQTFNGEVLTQGGMSYPLAAELRSNYGNDFKYIVQSYYTGTRVLSSGEMNITRKGNYMDIQAPDMLTLKMLKGTRAGLKEPNSILLSESTAKIFFGDTDPMNKLMKIDNREDVSVTGVYEDLPNNSQFKDLSFIAPWELYLSSNRWIREMENGWGVNFVRTYVQLANHVDINIVSAKIRDTELNKVAEADRNTKPAIFLHPMSRWHLYDEFKNGVNTGGSIEFIWLFSVIGLFVLFLACINFMNLSTARSERRAKEVGIRKSIGSIRGQLITQFFSESILFVFISFASSLLLVELMLPFFNQVANKRIEILWTNPVFWLFGIGFSLVIGLIAGSYPALYLSSFQPIKVLKGTFRAGRFATIPRRVLVVVQFTVSVTLIIGSIIVFRQIEFAKNRPVGYNRDSLVHVPMFTADIKKHFDVFREELKNTGAVIEVAESQSPTTELWTENTPGFDWEGKDPAVQADFATIGVSHDFGKTVGWQFSEGRDFSREFNSDSSGFVLNESAVKYMGLKKPVGEIIKWGDTSYKVIGVIKDMVMGSPYQPVKQSIFMIARPHENFAIIKINSVVTPREALSKIETVFKKFAPASPFEYKFTEEMYAEKFGDEERSGKLATFFAILAISISCLGIFGLASFTAEQRTKEIGIRKVLGASVANVCQMLSKEFVVLVILSCLVAIPVSYYFLHAWLQRYEYRTEMAWWIFVVAGAGALLITLLTVSFQSIKAAVANPVRSLRSE